MKKINAKILGFIFLVISVLTAITVGVAGEATLGSDEDTGI